MLSRKSLISILISPLLLVLPPLSAAQEDNAEPAQRAVIPFADMGGIENWRALDDYTLLVEGRNDTWYQAEMMGPCFGLSRAVTIGFVTNHDGTLDSFSSILVENDRCYFKSFTEIPTPAPLPER